MGRYKAEHITIRRINGLEIVFRDRLSIYVRREGEKGYTVFHRWYAPRGSYTGGWSNFRQKLRRSRKLSLLSCFETAAQYDIQSLHTDRELKLEGEDVVYIGNNDFEERKNKHGE